MTQLEKAKNAIAQTRVVTVQSFMENQKDLIAKVLPKTITPERLLGIFTMLLKSSPKLSQCSQASLIGAVIQTAQLGLQPGNMGHVHLVPFNNKGTMECQLIIGYKGIVELVNRSGNATILTAEVVYSNDQFQYELGLTPILRHIPSSGDRGEKVGVYCIAKNLIANEKVFIYIQKEEIEKVKTASKSKDNDFSPWKTWEDEMWKKTAVKRISKLLPLSSESQKALSADETIKTKIDADMADLPDETKWDGDTIDATEEKSQTPTPQPATQPEPTSDDKISEPQQKRFYAIAKGAGIEEPKAWLLDNFAVESSKDIKKADYEKICKTAQEYKKGT